MLTLKGLFQIATNGHVKSPRACATSTGLPNPRLELQRLIRQRILLAERGRRRCWLAAQWRLHEERCRRRRTLPPADAQAARKKGEKNEA